MGFFLFSVFPLSTCSFVFIHVYMNQIILNNENRGLREKESFNWQHLNTVYISARSLKNESLSNYVPFQGTCVVVHVGNVCTTIFPPINVGKLCMQKFQMTNICFNFNLFCWQISVCFTCLFQSEKSLSWLKIIPRIVHHFLLPWNNTTILLFTLVIYNGHGLPLLSIYDNSSSGHLVGRLIIVAPSWK